MKKVRILIGVTASIAVIKLPELLDYIENHCGHRKCALNFEVKIVFTKNSQQFVTEDMQRKLRGHFLRSFNRTEMYSQNETDIPCTFLGELLDFQRNKNTSEPSPPKDFRLTGVYSDDDELFFWREYRKVLHISLKSWADVLLISPLDANTLAKIVNGMADNLLTCVVRAWQVGVKPLLVATAMNSDMYNHPITKQQLENLTTTFLAHHISPTYKVLACGEFGIGAMASPEDIFSQLLITIAN